MPVDPVGAPPATCAVPNVRWAESFDAVRGLLVGAGVPIGRPVVVVVGGAGGIATSEPNAIEGVLRDALVPVFEHFGAVVVDGGTDAGVMRSVGRARAAAGARFPLVGVAVAATVVDGAPEVIAGAAEIEPNHTLVLLVPGSGWGDEVTWISVVADALAHGSPSVTVLINGGDIAYRDVAASLTGERPVLVLAGSGRTADALAAARAGESADPRAVALASSDLVAFVGMGNADAVRDALERLLSEGEAASAPSGPSNRP